MEIPSSSFIEHPKVTKYKEQTIRTLGIGNSDPMRYRISKSSGNSEVARMGSAGRALPTAALPSDDFSLEAAEEDRFRFFLRKSLLT